MRATPISLTVSRAMRGTRQQESPVRLNVARVHVPLSAILAAWVFRQVGRFVAWAVSCTVGAVLRRPWLLLVPVALIVVSKVSGGHTVLLVLALVAMVGPVVWWWRWRESFTRRVWWSLRGAWRARFVYGFAWRPAMVTTGLAVNLDGAEYLPKLLWFLITDPLTEPIPPHSSDDGGGTVANSGTVGSGSGGSPVGAPGSDVGSEAEKRGVTDRRRYTGRVVRGRHPVPTSAARHHVLVVGATRSGKGSVIWSTLHALGPAIRDGVVAVLKWAHMLGFRGHFSTKSRSYSITLGRLRRARQRFQTLAAEARRCGEALDVRDLEARPLADDQDTTMVIGSWAYQGTGWTQPGDEALALAAAARAREYDQWRAQRRNAS